MQFFIFIFWLIFLLINLKILFSDITKKKIFNYDILFIFFLSSIFIIFQWKSDFISILPVFLGFFALSFGLYYLGLWSAGDAKYLISLSLFLKPSLLIPFLGNIALVSIVYLFCYSLSKRKLLFLFTQIKIFFRKGKESISKEETYSQKNILNILNSINIFFLVFLIIRLVKIYVFDAFIIGNIIQEESLKSYALFFWMLCTMSFLLLVKKWSEKILPYLTKIFQCSEHIIKTGFIFIFFLLLSIFLFLEYSFNPNVLKENMYQIFSFYIFLFFSIKIILFFYRITFDIGEKIQIPIEKLEAGDRINLIYFTDNILNKIEKSSGEEEKNLTIIRNIGRSIDTFEIQALKELYTHLGLSDTIEIYKSFPFAPSLFIGFCISFLWGESILRYLLEMITRFF